MQASSSGSDSDAEDFLPVKRAVQQRSKRIEEEEEEDAPIKAPAKRAKKSTPAGMPLSRCVACKSAPLPFDNFDFGNPAICFSEEEHIHRITCFVKTPITKKGQAELNASLACPVRSASVPRWSHNRGKHSSLLRVGSLHDVLLEHKRP